jgi:TolA-binding protein
MSQQNEENVFNLENINVEETLGKAEMFIRKNRNILIGVAVGLLAIIGGLYYYNSVYLPEMIMEGNDASMEARTYLKQNDLDKALKGDGKNMGFLALADEYSGTPVGDRANYYAATILMAQGKFQDAIEHLEGYHPGDLITESLAMGLIGDCQVELNKKEDALAQYEKAASNNPNNLTSPLFLFKAGMLAEELNKSDKAIELYKKIKADYRSSDQGMDIDKYIARAEAKTGK